MAEFNGFPSQYFAFFNQLEKNNSKEWFEKHREDYDEFVLHPAREFVAAMGNKLRKIAPDAFYSEALIDYAYTHYKNMLPLHQWLKSI